MLTKRCGYGKPAPSGRYCAGCAVAARARRAVTLPSGCVVVASTPAAVSIAIASLPVRSAIARPTMRVPFPHASDALPSGFTMRMRTSATALGPSTSRPSPPSPRRGSVRRPARRASSGHGRSSSATIR